MREIIGIVKDTFSLSKLTLLSKPLHLAVLRTTSHQPSTPPHDHHIATLLAIGDSSRATASALIHALMGRLHRTHDAYVALKCLLTIHHIIKRGPFILRDQLAVFPNSSGRNSLKLSGFRDGSSAATWVLSGWVRWYGRYLETILSNSKNLGFDISNSSSSSILEKENHQDSISSLMNSDLLRDFGSLVVVVEEICEAPDDFPVERDRLLNGIMELLASDYLSTVNEMVMRLSEFKERVGLLGFNDSVELCWVLERVSICREKSLKLFSIRKPSIETLWEMIDELNDRIGMVNLRKHRRLSWSESARFGDRDIRMSDCDRMIISSGRLIMN